MHKAKRFALLSFAALAGAIIGSFVTIRAYSGYNLNRLRNVLYTIEQKYVEEFSGDELYLKTTRSLVKSLDRYSEYYTEDEWEKTKNQLEGRYVGIGVTIRKREEGFIVTQVFDGSPAKQAGFKEGDIFVSVDGKPVKDLEIEGLVLRVKGQEGTTVKITVERDGEELNIAVTRKMVTLAPLIKGIIRPDVGYLRITDFYDLNDSIEKILQELWDEGARRLIIDLRFNLGGLLEESVKLSDIFLPSGKITTVESRDIVDNAEYTAKKDSTQWETIPLAVLVNGKSASASEIFAAAIKDNDRGKLIGTNTYGKGVVQKIYRLLHDDYLKITTSRYKTPSGEYIMRSENPEESGVSPDIKVELDEKVELEVYSSLNGLKYQKLNIIEIPEYDVQLQKAIEALKEEIENE